MPITFLVKIACVILLRSWRATLVLAFMVFSAVAALVFLSALAVGTNDAMIRNSTGLYSGHIAGTMLAEKDLALLQTEGVKKVLVRRSQQALISKNEAYEPLLLVGVDPQQENGTTAFWQKSVAGRPPLPGEKALYLSEATAKRLDARPGDMLGIGQRPGMIMQTLTLSGIYKTGMSSLDQGLAFCPAEVLPAGAVQLSAAVFLETGVSVEERVARYRQNLPEAIFAAWPEFMPDLKQLIDLEAVCMALVIILVFAIVAVGISCVFLIFTLKNLREHGIMKAMGLLPGDTALLLVVQIGLLTFCAASLGVLAGGLAVAVFAHVGIDISAYTSHNQYFAVSGVLYPRLTWPALFTPPCVAMLFALAAAIWPIVYITYKNPADILRSV